MTGIGLVDVQLEFFCDQVGPQSEPFVVPAVQVHGGGQAQLAAVTVTLIGIPLWQVSFTVEGAFVIPDTLRQVRSDDHRRAIRRSGPRCQAPP